MPRLHRLPLPSAVHEFLKDEERAGTIVIGGLTVVVSIVFTAAVLAMLLMQ